jgi:hypothetical protein
LYNPNKLELRQLLKLPLEQKKGNNHIKKDFTKPPCSEQKQILYGFKKVSTQLTQHKLWGLDNRLLWTTSPKYIAISFRISHIPFKSHFFLHGTIIVVRLFSKGIYPIPFYG